MPPMLYENTSDLNFVLQVSHSASFAGDKKVVFLYSLALFNTGRSATDL